MNNFNIDKLGRVLKERALIYFQKVHLLKWALLQKIFREPIFKEKRKVSRKSVSWLDLVLSFRINPLFFEKREEMEIKVTLLRCTTLLSASLQRDTLRMILADICTCAIKTPVHVFVHSSNDN